MPNESNSLPTVAGDAACCPHMSWITETLAVGGSYPMELAMHLALAHGIKAVVDMRAEQCDDADVLSGQGLAFLHLPTFDLHPVAAVMLDEGVSFARGFLARQEPVLIHCEHGIGRAALMALCVLVDQGHEPLPALELAKRRRPRISPNPDQYHAWASWLRQRGRRVPHFDDFAAIAYRHLKEGRAGAAA